MIGSSSDQERECQSKKWEEMEKKREAQSCIQALFISLIKLDTIKTRPGCCFCCVVIFFCFCTFMGLLLLSWRGRHPTCSVSLLVLLLLRRKTVRMRGATSSLMPLMSSPDSCCCHLLRCCCWSSLLLSYCCWPRILNSWRVESNPRYAWRWVAQSCLLTKAAIVSLHYGGLTWWSTTDSSSFIFLLLARL